MAGKGGAMSVHGRRVSRRDFLKAAGTAGLASAGAAALPSCGGLTTGVRAGAADSLRRLAAKKGLVIGSAFSPAAFRKDPQYGEILAREFNGLVAENAMKLEALQRVRGQFDFGRAEEIMGFARAHDMKVRAVPLVWHEALPDWARGRTFPRQEALDILREHIITVMRHFRGRIFAWDVLNEALSDKGPGLREEGPWFHSIGPDYVERVYHMAHEADPDAALFYNEFGMDGMSDKADRCYRWIKDLLARGVPIHGLGLQYHIQADACPAPADVARNIKRFNDLGLAVHITELDVWLKKGAGPADFERQAAVYREIFETALAAPKCPAVFLWGFTDRYSWVPGISNGTYDQGLIFDREYRPKPAYAAIAAALR